MASRAAAWTSDGFADSLHLTLRFPGPTLEDLIGAAAEATRGGEQGRAGPSTSRSAAPGRSRRPGYPGPVA